MELRDLRAEPKAFYTALLKSKYRDLIPDTVEYAKKVEDKEPSDVVETKDVRNGLFRSTPTKYICDTDTYIVYRTTKYTCETTIPLEMVNHISYAYRSTNIVKMKELAKEIAKVMNVDPIRVVFEYPIEQYHSEGFRNIYISFHIIDENGPCKPTAAARKKFLDQQHKDSAVRAVADLTAPGIVAMLESAGMPVHYYSEDKVIGFKYGSNIKAYILRLIKEDMLRTGDAMGYDLRDALVLKTKRSTIDHTAVLLDVKKLPGVKIEE